VPSPVSFDEIRGDDAIRVEQKEDVGVGVSCAQVAGPAGPETVVCLKVVVDVQPIDQLDHAPNVLLRPVVADVHFENRGVRLLRQ
jgi:hypothetical protein